MNGNDLRLVTSEAFKNLGKIESEADILEVGCTWEVGLRRPKIMWMS
jgi:hypothetical protein